MHHAVHMTVVPTLSHCARSLDPLWEFWGPARRYTLERLSAGGAIKHVCYAWLDEASASGTQSGACDWGALHPTMHYT